MVERFDVGDEAGALQEGERLVADFPNDPAARMTLVNLYRGVQRPERAVELIMDTPPSVRPRLQARKGDRVTISRAFVDLLRKHLQQGQLADARALEAPLLSWMAQDVIGLTQIATAYERLGLTDEAIRFARDEVIPRHPEDVVIRHFLVNVLHHHRRDEAVVRAGSEALELIERIRETVEDQGELEAIRHERFIRADVAFALLALNRPIDALTILSVGVQRFPKDALLEELYREVEERRRRHRSASQGGQSTIPPVVGGAESMPWKPVGTREEAEAFARESAIRETLYYVVPHRDVTGLKREGFDPKRMGWGARGKVMYLFRTREHASWYAHSLASSKNIAMSVLQMKVNVRRVKRFLRPGEASDYEADQQRLRGRLDASLADLLREEGYDAASLETSLFMEDYVMVFDSEQRTMIIEEPRTSTGGPPAPAQGPSGGPGTEPPTDTDFHPSRSEPPALTFDDPLNDHLGTAFLTGAEQESDPGSGTVPDLERTFPPVAGGAEGHPAAGGVSEAIRAEALAALAAQLPGRTFTADQRDTLIALYGVGVRRFDRLLKRRWGALGHDAQEKIQPMAAYLRSLGVRRIGNVFEAFPFILRLNVEEHLQPTAEYLRSLGVRRLDHVIETSPAVLGLKLETNLKPTVAALRSLGVRRVGRLVEVFPALLSYNLERKLVPTFALLRALRGDAVVPADEVRQLLIRNEEVLRFLAEGSLPRPDSVAALVARYQAADRAHRTQRKRTLSRGMRKDPEGTRVWLDQWLTARVPAVSGGAENNDEQARRGEAAHRKAQELPIEIRLEGLTETQRGMLEHSLRSAIEALLRMDPKVAQDALDRFTRGPHYVGFVEWMQTLIRSFSLIEVQMMVDLTARPTPEALAALREHEGLEGQTLWLGLDSFWSRYPVGIRVSEYANAIGFIALSRFAAERSPEPRMLEEVFTRLTFARPGVLEAWHEAGLLPAELFEAPSALERSMAENIARLDFLKDWVLHGDPKNQVRYAREFVELVGEEGRAELWELINQRVLDEIIHPERHPFAGIERFQESVATDRHALIGLAGLLGDRGAANVLRQREEGRVVENPDELIWLREAIADIDSRAPPSTGGTSDQPPAPPQHHPNFPDTFTLGGVHWHHQPTPDQPRFDDPLNDHLGPAFLKDATEEGSDPTRFVATEDVQSELIDRVLHDQPVAPDQMLMKAVKRHELTKWLGMLQRSVWDREWPMSPPARDLDLQQMREQPLTPAQQQLVESHHWIVATLARRHQDWRHFARDYRELVSAGNEGLVEAAQTFDGTRGNRFSTFAYQRVRGAILDHIRRFDVLRRSERRALRRLDHLREQIGRDPTEAEIMEALGWFRQYARWIGGLAVQRLRVRSL
ncbi:MAG: sigma factor, partial [Candidatus Omnitrophota bacterium]|nr:sigma factor [Candidatus Omnitrophota bacterium]